MSKVEVVKSFVNSTDELAHTIGSFDTACETKLFFGNKENPQDVTNFKGIFNLGTGLLSTIASNQYQIIQHNDVAQAVVEALAGLNLNVKGLIKNGGDVLTFDLYFDDSQYDLKDDATGIKLGIRIVNSYNKTNSLRLEMYGYRRICSNGMAIGSAVNDVREVVMHTGEKKPLEKIQSIVEVFIKNVINSSARLQELVDNSMIDSVEWNIAEKILNNLLPIEKHRAEIFAMLTEGQTLTRWELYNAITNYVSHGEALKPSVISALELKSRKVLTKTFSALEEEIVVAEATTPSNSGEVA